jgi:hypothetical protein
MIRENITSSGAAQCGTELSAPNFSVELLDRTLWAFAFEPGRESKTG